MKKQFKLIVILIVITNFYSSAGAQGLSPAETKRLADEASELDFQATELMMEFLVKPNADTFDKSRGLWEQSFKNYEKVMGKGTAGSGNKTMDQMDAVMYNASKSLVQSKLSLYDQRLKESTLKETDDDRKKKVTFKGESYPISKTNKDRFETLETAWKSQGGK